uniref:PXA domain-containing protein n=1 Tax=Rhodnius prolixus TaxID=13249 RepID=T1HCS5_RHOPR
MEGDDGNKQTYVLLQDSFLHFVAIVLILTTLFTSIAFGLISGLTVLLSFSLGILAFHGILNYDIDLPSLLPLISKSFQSNKNADIAPSKCNVCGDSNCNREKIVHKQKPWAGLILPEEVDSAIENLLERTLDQFVQSWYKNISLDNSFPMEIRHNIRYAASVVLSRVLQVNLGTFITKKIIPAAVQHIVMCLEADPSKVAFHPALYNRKVELDYLRLRVKDVLPYILEQRNAKCSIFSTIVTEILAGWLLLPLTSVSDSTTINNLFLVLLGAQPTQFPPTSAIEVEFLENFVKKKTGLDSNNWITILDCLLTEEFNRRMLTPELSSEELDLLYRDAWDLFSVYFSPHSPDNIGFSQDLVIQMRKVLSKDVTKLRTSPPLFQAYEHAYSLLDKNYCPLFHTSDEFYTWLCGPRTPCSVNLSGANTPSLPGSPVKPGYKSKRNEGAVSKLSNKLHKIKGALRAQTVDGHAYASDATDVTEFTEDLTLMEEEEERDLSSWRVRIFNVDNKLDPSTGKQTPTYTIFVQRIRPADGSVISEWTVDRRLADFYTLESKLTEFHGDFPDTQLPPCGLLAPSPPTEAHLYESYLQKLLSNPSLRGSDLLHWFLSSSGEFIIEDNALGRLLRKSVPISLRKERGQNIEPFIATFFASTDSKNKNKSEWKNIEMTPRNIRCITNTVFRDNLGISLHNFPIKPVDNPILLPNLKGPSDCLILLGVKVFKMPNFVIKLAIAIYTLLNKPFDSLSSFYIEKRIKSLLIPQRIAHLTKLLEWIIFEKQNKSNPELVLQSLTEKINSLKGWSSPLYHTIFLVVQNPILNKQLFYKIFDIILDELFPEKTMETK